ncbi:hypothetical protein [Chlamydiifrater phoenicopteri]|uniref:hypothetical protein n=1 Tax=Chlamydiifrater phoenicopteri TaxID=2681469 RepID=UPI001BCFA6C2|nr:hypothetical protein [Chlamydiifrater phoenicopteri]
MSTISGGGMSPLGGPNWDPNMMGGPEKAAEEVNDSEHIDTIDTIDISSDKTDSVSTTGKKQEAVVRSSSSLEHFSEAQLNKRKLEKTQEKMGAFSKLKQSMNKMKSGMKAFLSGFGSKGASISAKKARDSGEGTSLIPSEIPESFGKSADVSSSMMDFYFDASGMARSEYESIDTDMRSTQSSSFFGIDNPIFDHSALSLEEVEASSVLFAPTKPTISPDDVDVVYSSWTSQRLGGEVVSKLMDANVETTSLLRRSPLLAMEGMVDFAAPELRTASATSFSRKISPSNDELVEEMSARNEEVTLETGEAVEELSENEQKKDIAEKITQEQIENQKAKEKLLLNASLLGGGPYLASSSSFSSSGFYKFRLPRGSGNESSPGVLGKEVRVREDGFDIHKSGMKSQKFSSKVVDNDTLKIEKTLTPLTFKRYESLGESSSSSSDFRYREESFLERPIKINTRSSSFSDNRQERPLERKSAITCSAYLFSSCQGMAFQLSPPKSKAEHLKELNDIPGRNSPPDPLIYQYRNVAVDPALVLRPHSPYGEGSSKMSIQGKPEAASAYNDSSDDNNDRQKREERNEEEIEEIAEEDNKSN